MGAQGYESVEHQNSKGADAALVIVPIFVGGCLGFAWVKSLIYTPKSIANQFSFQSCDLFKYLLAAAGTAMLIQSVSSVLFRNSYQRNPAKTENAGALAVLLGGCTFGIGMAVCGGSVGTMYAQLGTGIASGGWILLGLFLGVITFAFLQPYVFRGCQQKGRLHVVNLDDMIDETRCEYWYIALPLAAVIGGCVFLLEEFSPSKIKVVSWLPTFRAEWPATYAGMIAGGCAAILKLSTQQSIGALNSIIAMISVPFTPLFNKCNIQLPPTFQDNRGWRSLWQVWMLVAAAIASLATAEDLHILGRGVNAEVGWAITGGFLMALGGLLSCGDLHYFGVAGVADLNVMAFLGVASIFLGGCLTGTCSYYLLDANNQFHLKRTIYK